MSCLREVQTISQSTHILPLPSLTHLTTGGVLNPLKNTTNTSHNELLHQDPLQPPLEPRKSPFGPPPPSYAPGGFVMPSRQARLACRTHLKLPPPARGLGKTRYKTLHARGLGRPTRYKTLPAHTPAGDTGTKLSQHPQNGPFQHVLRQQGEISHAPTPHLTHQRTPPPISHAIQLNESSITSRNVAIPMITIQLLK